MKKTILALILVFTILLCSCGNTGVSQTTAPTSADTKSTESDAQCINTTTDDFHFFGFEDLNNEQEFKQQATSNTVFLVNYLNEEKLTIDGLKLKFINVALYKDDNGKRTGKQRVNLYLHDENCTSCISSNCPNVDFDIWYCPEGVDLSLENNLENYEKISDDHYKFKETSIVGTDTHLLFVNSKCFIRLYLLAEWENYDEAVAAISAYADYLREAMSKTGNGDVAS